MGTVKRVSRANKTPEHQSRIPAEVSDSALISATLVQSIHRSLLMCHLLEERVAAISSDEAMQRRVHGGDGALVVGGTSGLQIVDVVIVAGDTLLPHITRETPLPEVLSSLSRPSHSAGSVERQIDLSAAAATRAKDEGRIVLLLCNEREQATRAAAVADACVEGRLPLVVLAHCGKEVPTTHAPFIPVEAHDAIAIYRVTQEAIWRARRGGGPTIVGATEVAAQPAGEHFESEALVHLREYMQQHRAWDEAATARMRNRLEVELDRAFASASLPA